jgi:hypothetical protein
VRCRRRFGRGREKTRKRCRTFEEQTDNRQDSGLAEGKVVAVNRQDAGQKQAKKDQRSLRQAKTKKVTGQWTEKLAKFKQETGKLQKGCKTQ